MDPSFPEFGSQSLGLPSQGSSDHIFSCKWAWCRCTFSDNAALVRHVVHDHARRSMPVRRRDIAMIRRVEQGSGSSLHMSSLVKSMYASDSQQSAQQSAMQGISSNGSNQPTSSLPSPPNSSPTVDTFHLREKNSPGTEKPLTSNLQAKGEDGNENENRTSSQRFFEHATTQALHPTPTFASFDSQPSSPTPVLIPASPSFSSLVSKKRKLEFNLPENGPASRNKPLRSRSHPLSQSTSTTSSSTSQDSVAMQLTQSPSFEGDDNDEDSVDEDDAPEPQQRPSEESSRFVAVEANAGDAEEFLYEDELSWGSTQSQYHQAPQQSSDIGSENAAESEETGPAFADFGSLSQPPSQFQYDSFPIHRHGPKLPPSQTRPSSSVPMPLSTPAPLSSQSFAVSTPVRQNWYHSIVRCKSSKQLVYDSELGREEETQIMRKSQPKSTNVLPPAWKPTKKSAFRSGVLQITPISIPESPSQEKEKTKSRHVDPTPHETQGFPAPLDDPQDYMDLDPSDSFEDFSYPPLQTQAPYESQTMSQL